MRHCCSLNLGGPWLSRRGHVLQLEGRSQVLCQRLPSDAFVYNVDGYSLDTEEKKRPKTVLWKVRNSHLHSFFFWLELRSKSSSSSDVSISIRENARVSDHPFAHTLSILGKESQLWFLSLYFHCDLRFLVTRNS